MSINEEEPLPSTICSFDPIDTESIMFIMGGSFTLEECGPFFSCSNEVVRFDKRLPGGGVQVVYCQINWTVVGASIAALLLVAAFIWWKRRSQYF